MAPAPLRRALICTHKNLLVTLLGVILLGLAGLYARGWLPWLLVGGPLVYLGIGLPLLVGRRERLRRASELHARSLRDWGFAGRDRDGPWLNYIDHALVYDCPELRGRYFYAEWLVIHNGRLIINPGEAQPALASRSVRYAFERSRTYAWDGCSPKIVFYWLALFGSPDWWERRTPVLRIQHGHLQAGEVFWPLAHHASLVHDALYQYLHVVPVSKRQADRLFQRMLREAGMPAWLAALYFLAVHLFGAPHLRGLRNPNSVLRCLTPLPGNRSNARQDSGERTVAEPLVDHPAID
ncbi:DUF1353 domain-containing protein [Pseudomonas sp. UL073]|uniref:DUF1353 domain-containing protein n=1 Tax=Zestomonas insulae TaxID=2809017 RepID=A0ABS2ID82_9GAMM|nr:DUF1353 domain-containing protein [Pseudomonas insulae]MBM7060917.1 DUF1353 domain-containing protein [Pseudomonas insulae]